MFITRATEGLVSVTETSGYVFNSKMRYTLQKSYFVLFRSVIFKIILQRSYYKYEKI